MNATANQEFILPSGKFCKIRRVTAGDFILAQQLATTEVPFLAHVFARAILIDDLGVSGADYMNFDVQDHVEIMKRFPKLDGPIIP